MTRNLFAVTCVLLLCSPWPYAQAPNPPAPHRQPQDYKQYVAYWTAEPGWRTELQLRNNLDPGDLTVTPTLRSADGIGLRSSSALPFSLTT